MDAAGRYCGKDQALLVIFILDKFEFTAIYARYMQALYCY